MTGKPALLKSLLGLPDLAGSTKLRQFPHRDGRFSTNLSTHNRLNPLSFVVGRGHDALVRNEMKEGVRCVRRGTNDAPLLRHLLSPLTPYDAGVKRKEQVEKMTKEERETWLCRIHKAEIGYLERQIEIKQGVLAQLRELIESL